MSVEIKPLKYFPAFDGVRGIFCIMIISHHWVMPYLQGPFTFMWWLLQVFFMMSSYLITRILLYDKTKMETKALFKRFYQRRALRIFPLYFLYVALMGGLLLLAGTTAAGAENRDLIYFKENWGFLFTYTYNFTEIVNHFRGIDYIPTALFSHLWSLSLEEQFYLVIPFAITFLSFKNIKRVVVAFIVLAPLIRFFAYAWLKYINPDAEWLGLIVVRNTIFQMDTLAYGMAVALFDTAKVKRLGEWFLFVFTIWVIYTFVSAHFIVKDGYAPNIHAAIKRYEFMNYHLNYTIYFTLTNFMCGLFVAAVVNRTFITRIFNNKLFIHLGKISYGIYVWHYFALLLAGGLLRPIIGGYQKYIGNFGAELLMYLFYLVVLVIVAEISYKYFESYFIHLKKKT
ncbi:MAG: acyltransferase [Chitinophagales bacterium]|nr:acyltransferase [Chitinophagales bacterium]